MAEWHLRELRDALEQRGWRLIAELPSDKHNVSAYWQLQRSSKKPAVVIAFDGLDESKVLPLFESYGCYVVGQERLILYFKKRSLDSTERHRVWQQELHDFVTQLDAI